MIARPPDRGGGRDTAAEELPAPPRPGRLAGELAAVLAANGLG
jgi:hypothetical protein